MLKENICEMRMETIERKAKKANKTIEVKLCSEYSSLGRWIISGRHGSVAT
jgi:hypothetical protein